MSEFSDLIESPVLKTSSLEPNTYNILINKHTENPGSGKYNDYDIDGTYLCRNCGLALFRADSKFASGCGWPSFDCSLLDNVKPQPDIDGRRTEIVCRRCNGHLGHVFHGEGFTSLNTRHCVNSLSVDFVPNLKVLDSSEIILSAGCFWGVEHYLRKLNGVLLTEVGYCGGDIAHPNYQRVCTGTTKHLEAVRVIYDYAQLSLVDLIKCFFEIHDFTQTDGQGPDVGSQYLSGIFCYNNAQSMVARQIIEQLTKMGYIVATQVRPMKVFWVAEDYHQMYYAQNGSTPYCHSRKQIF